MSITIVNDYLFKTGGDLEEGKAAARDLVRYFTDEVPEVQLSLWLESEENPLHHYHITVFDHTEAVEKVRGSKEIDRFVKRLYPHIDHSTFISPHCNVWIAAGSGVKEVSLERSS